MPAIRSAKRDVIVRVPRQIVVPDDGKGQAYGEGGLGEEEGRIEVGGSGAYRRSTSPVKLNRPLAEAGLERHIDPLKEGEGSSAVASGGVQRGHDQPQPTYSYASQATSAAEWNSLLIWARRQRGPQWDSATGMWQVDQGSTEYYAFGNDPARHTKLSMTAHRPSSGPADGRGDVTNANPTQHPSHSETSGIPPPPLFGHENGGESTSGTHTPGAHSGLYNEDSPPVGPGGRRSRAR